MALALGFFVLFAAGLAGAYFAGAHSARISNSSPAPLSRTNTSAAAVATQPHVSSANTTEKAVVDTTSSDLTANQPSDAEKTAAKSDVFADTRNFKRLSFSGTALATIYPYPQKLLSSNEPVKCTVLTRDLCCGGIGIAHNERLVPHQTIVLDALGKLLVGEVRWCQRIDKDFYIAGCRLVKTKT